MVEHREGSWTGRDGEPATPSTAGLRLAFEATGLLAGAAAFAALAAPFGFAPPVAIGALVFGTIGLAGRHADDRRRTAGESVQTLLEAFGAGPVWRVDLMVRQGEAPTGCDRGLLWVESGRIAFTGLRTSFVLAPSQARDGVRHAARLDGQRLRLNLELARETRGGLLSLSFWPLAENLRRAESDAADLRAALDRTLKGLPTDPTEASGQWPPVALGPGARTPRALFVRAALPHVAATLTAGAVAGIAFDVAPWLGSLTLAGLAGGANAIVHAGNAPRWQAWRDARRVRGWA